MLYDTITVSSQRRLRCKANGWCNYNYISYPFLEILHKSSTRACVSRLSYVPQPYATVSPYGVPAGHVLVFNQVLLARE